MIKSRFHSMRIRPSASFGGRQGQDPPPPMSCRFTVRMPSRALFTLVNNNMRSFASISASKQPGKVSAHEGAKRMPLDEAVRLVRAKAVAKFDETIDVCIELNVNPTKADQNVRGFTSLPHGTGKVVRIAALVPDDMVEAALAAGATYAGDKDLADKIMGGFVDFEKCVSMPSMMATVGKLGRVLGPRGMMPNPKSGTLNADVVEAIHQLKGGQLDFRVDKRGYIRAGVGKASFPSDDIKQNIQSFVQAVLQAKPPGSKGTYMKSVSLSSTMGKGSATIELAEAQGRVKTYQTA